MTDRRPVVILSESDERRIAGGLRMTGSQEIGHEGTKRTKRSGLTDMKVGGQTQFPSTKDTKADGGQRVMANVRAGSGQEET